MKLKLHECQNMNNALAVLANADIPESKTSYTLGWNAQKLDRVVRLIDRERGRITRKWAEKDNNGNVILVEGNYKILDNRACEAEFNDFLEQEEEVELRKVKLSDLGEAGNKVGILFGLVSILEDDSATMKQKPKVAVAPTKKAK